jgi:23S rRNA pseudouridine955/2504/2580 synthase
MKAVLSIPVSKDDGEVRVDRWFRRHFPKLTQGQIEKLVRTGQVRVDGARVKAADRITPGQIVRVPPLPEAAPRSEATGVKGKDAEFAMSLVIHRDDDVIVLNKPFGLAVQGGTKIERCIDDLLPALKFGREEKPKLVHRLDRDTTGVLVLARHPRAAAHLASVFRSREGDKIYWALVAGAPRPADGEIRGWMRKAPGAHESDQEMVRRCLQQDEGAVHAITQYSAVSEAGGKAAWMALKPVTGRTHQLRFHMAEIGHGIIGDPKYKSDRETPGGLDNKLHLHARAIRIAHPTKGMLKVQAPLPAHMSRSFEALGFNAKDAKNPFAPFER